MMWLTFRQYRTEFFIGGGLLVLLAMFLVLTGMSMSREFTSSGLSACLATESNATCSGLSDRFANGFNWVIEIANWLNFVPAVIGVILAAPLVMEFEQGTYRLGWTQSVTRQKWLLVRLAVALAAALAIGTAVMLLMTWWRSPLDDANGRLAEGFTFQGPAFVSYTLFAVAFAVAVGIISRRGILTFMATILGFLGIRLAIEYLPGLAICRLWRSSHPPAKQSCPLTEGTGY